MAEKLLDQTVIIVGAGPSGLATAACLNILSIPNILLEREDCFGSMWKKYAYDRLHLHLKKHFCELPHMPFPDNYPAYVPKNLFIEYLDGYASHFNIFPKYNRTVEMASRDAGAGKWVVKARNGSSGEVEEYSARFLVVATGEATDPYVPEVEGLRSFAGEVIHTTQYKNGKRFGGKNVLIVGAGNSGMEIALDLVNHGANTSIVVRSPIHVLSREMVYLALIMLKHFSHKMVDSMMVMMSKIVYGDLTKYGISRPTEGPFFMKVAYGKYPFIDVGTVKKIKSGDIQVLPTVTNIKGNEVKFKNDKSRQFDTIIFATGFKRSTNKWLKDDDCHLNEDGIPKQGYPDHWKGKNGLYCVGLSRRGLYGIHFDTQSIANDIKELL